VLDSAGDKKIQVIQQIRRLTRLSLKESKDPVDAAPAAVLRVPDQPMACAAKSILESVAATVSIIDLASSQRSTDVHCGEPGR
jgi:large subunit ribosomal protein L7/L12